MVPLTMPKLSFPRAVIFDVYRTLLEVGAPPDDAEQRWLKLWQKSGTTRSAPTLAEFSARCRDLITRDHEESRARGIAHPEVIWPWVVRRALPEDARIDADWIPAHQACLRGIRRDPGADAVLGRLSARGVPLGILSNAQAYTLGEMGEAFADSRVAFATFDMRLCVWSFDTGFSKPDTHGFQVLATRLGHEGIFGDEILMVGDRMDNDIEPARRFGWQTWHLASGSDAGGSWEDLQTALAEAES